MKCLQCRSERIVKNVRMADYAHGGAENGAKLVAYRKPDATFFRGAVQFPLIANVCTECGFVMLSVSAYHAKRIEAMHKGTAHSMKFN